MAEKHSNSCFPRTSRSNSTVLKSEPLVLLALGERNMSETKPPLDECRTLHIVNPSQVPFGNVEAPEPFVSAEEAARFLSVKRRQILALARKGLAGAYPLGTGTVRRYGYSGSPSSQPPWSGTRQPQRLKNAIRSLPAVFTLKRGNYEFSARSFTQGASQGRRSMDAALPDDSRRWQAAGMP